MKQFSYFNPNRFLTFPQEFGQFLEAVLINSVFYEQALNMKIDEDPEVVSTLADFKSKMLVREYENISIKDDIQVTDEEIANYYQKNTSEEFMSNPTFETREIYVNEKETAEKLLKRARAGEDFEALAAVNTERYKDKKGYLGFIHEKRYGAIGKTASMLEAGQLCSEPIKSGSGWSIIKVYDTKPAEPKELESVKNTIENTLKKEKTAKAKDKLLAELKRRFSVKIWWDTLNLEA